jgi:hypothetical protein
MPVLSEKREGVGGATTTTVGGTMTGGGGGGGGATIWAWADVDANAMMSAKATAMAGASRPGAALSLTCGGLDEPRINIIPKKAQRKIPKST